MAFVRRNVMRGRANFRFGAGAYGLAVFSGVAIAFTDDGWWMIWGFGYAAIGAGFLDLGFSGFEGDWEGEV